MKNPNATLWLFNIAMEKWQNQKNRWLKVVIFHGYVSHNQMVHSLATKLCLMGLLPVQFLEAAPRPVLQCSPDSSAWKTRAPTTAAATFPAAVPDLMALNKLGSLWDCDRAKFYLVEHVQYIRLYIYLYLYICVCVYIYMCVCVSVRAHQQISQRPTKSGEIKKSHACRATPRPAMLSRCLKKAKPRPGPCLHNESSPEKHCYII